LPYRTDCDLQRHQPLADTPNPSFVLPPVSRITLAYHIPHSISVSSTHFFELFSHPAMLPTTINPADSNTNVPHHSLAQAICSTIDHLRQLPPADKGSDNEMPPADRNALHRSIQTIYDIVLKIYLPRDLPEVTYEVAPTLEVARHALSVFVSTARQCHPDLQHCGQAQDPDGLTVRIYTAPDVRTARLAAAVFVVPRIHVFMGTKWSDCNGITNGHTNGPTSGYPNEQHNAYSNAYYTATPSGNYSGGYGTMPGGST
jgi:hypothetical protein